MFSLGERNATMGSATLEDLAARDETGRAVFGVASTAHGDLVLCRPGTSQGDDWGALDVADRIRLAEARTQRPALVVESDGGDYLVLIHDDLDPEHHLPLAPTDADLLANRAARARFGGRDDDVLLLTPWADEDDVVVIDLDGADVELPVVSREADGALSWHRHALDSRMAGAVQRELDHLAAEPGERFGVLTNTLGECRCVPDRTPLPQHEDIRRQSLLGTMELVEGVGSLSLAASRLAAIAERLAAADREGWQLVQPVTNGLAFLERPRS